MSPQQPSNQNSPRLSLNSSSPQGAARTPSATPTSYEEKLAFWLAEYARLPLVQNFIETYYEENRAVAEWWLVSV
jgi:hypothetical protein